MQEWSYTSMWVQASRESDVGSHKRRDRTAKRASVCVEKSGGALRE
jgi:hypothetical protein